MANTKLLTNISLACLSLVACFFVLAYLMRASDPPTNNPGENGEKYVLNFAAPPERGIWVGKFNNFAFRIDLKKSVKAISVPLGDQRLPDLIATFDYADCNTGQDFILERTVRELAPGDAAWVDEVEVTLAPSKQPNLKWTGGVCYGFREPGGKWNWNRTSAPFTYDSAANRFLARIAVRRGPIDAVKLVFDYDMPPQFVTSVTYTTRAIGPQPDPSYSPPGR